MLVHLLELLWQHAHAHKTDIERAVHKSKNYTETHSTEQGPREAASHSTSQKIPCILRNRNINFFCLS